MAGAEEAPRGAMGLGIDVLLYWDNLYKVYTESAFITNVNHWETVPCPLYVLSSLCLGGKGGSPSPL